jgi:hypothetical protein
MQGLAGQQQTQSGKVRLMAFVNVNSSQVVLGPDDTSCVRELSLHTLEPIVGRDAT